MDADWRIEGFVNDEIGRASAAGADVGVGGIEVHVARNILTGLDQTRRQNIFGGASLMCRDKIFESEYFSFDRGFETIERARTGVQLVAAHDRCPLILTHRAGA